MREKICTIQGKRAPSKRRNKRHVKKKKISVVSLGAEGACPAALR